MWSIEFTDLTVYILVFARMCGLVELNPVISRRNVPVRVRMALILGLTLILAPGVSVEGVAGLETAPSLIWALLVEVFVGLVCSSVFTLFYYMLFFAGDLLDTEFGLAMAKVFDPGSSIQMSVSSNLLNLLFMLYFFTTNGHLVLIKIFESSYQVVPVGGAVLSAEIPSFFFTLFTSVFSLALRLALPFLAAMFVAELSMGVLMKLVPQIHVFVISIQFKILMGMLLMLLFSVPLANFVDNYLIILFEEMEKALLVLAP